MDFFRLTWGILVFLKILCVPSLSDELNLGHAQNSRSQGLWSLDLSQKRMGNEVLVNFPFVRSSSLVLGQGQYFANLHGLLMFFRTCQDRGFVKGVDEIHDGIE